MRRSEDRTRSQAGRGMSVTEHTPALAGAAVEDSRDLTGVNISDHSSNTPRKSTLCAALGLAKRGFCVFPIHYPMNGECSCGNRECPSKAKHPLTTHGVSDATRDEATIREWFERWPLANLAIATGPKSDIVILDADGEEGEQSLSAIEKKCGPLPATLQAQTGRGRHIYFLFPHGMEVRNSSGRLGKKLDVRGDGGYGICPPSLHISGIRYRWTHQVKPAALPAAWCGAIQDTQRQPPAALSAVTTATLSEGQRNSTLTSLAGSMRKRGMTCAAIEKALLEENRQRCVPPLPETEVRQVAASVARYEPALPGPLGSPGAAAQPTKPAGFSLVGLGELLARPETPVDWLWQGRLAAGTVSAVVSKPKVGKSTFARNLCLSVARGEPFLGLGTKPGPCIYLALEERAEDVTADFRAMGATGDEPIKIHADTTPEAGVLALIGLVRDRKPVLVVIDPLFRMVHVKDDKAYAEMYKALGPLIDVARSTGSHLLVTHHMGKGMAKADPIDSPLGSTAIGGAVSSLVILKRTEAYRTIQTRQRLQERDGDMVETVLQFDPESRRLSVGGTRFEADRQDCEEAILEFLKAAGEEKTEPEIDSGVDGKTGLKRKALRELVENGRVTRKESGKKGDPYKYSFSCSHYIPGTREQETKNGGQTSVNTEEKLVPTVEQKSFLVPETEKTHFEGGPGMAEVEI